MILIDEMIKAGNASMRVLKDRISGIEMGPIEDGIETFQFYLDETKYTGYQKGRLRDVVLGYSEATDKSICAIALLSDLATLAD